MSDHMTRKCPRCRGFGGRIIGAGPDEIETACQDCDGSGEEIIYCEHPDCDQPAYDTWYTQDFCKQHLLDAEATKNMDAHLDPPIDTDEQSLQERYERAVSAELTSLRLKVAHLREMLTRAYRREDDWKDLYHREVEQRIK